MTFTKRKFEFHTYKNIHYLHYTSIQINISLSTYSVYNYPTNVIKLPVLYFISNFTSSPATQIFSRMLKYGVLFEPITT